MFPESAAGGWRRTSLRELPAPESPGPVPRAAVERLVAACCDGPGRLDARVYALSPAAAREMAQRRRPADRKLLWEAAAKLEKRLADAGGGRK
jgi:hypothetical protein